MSDAEIRMVESHSPPARPGDPTAAAFFDVDNTIVRGASIFHLAKGLYHRGFLTPRDILKFALQQGRFLALGEHPHALAEVQTRALAFIAGRSVAEMRSIGEEVFEEILTSKIWPGTLALARMHEDAGQRVWLVTATPIEIAEVIAQRLALTGALGTISEHVDGRYTGQLVGAPMHGEAKADAVAALAEREGLSLRRCAAYSDSSNDIPLLSMVGHPVAINPDGRLRAHARANGWQVHDYRTTRRAAKIGLPAACAGVLAGFAAGASLANRRQQHLHLPPSSGWQRPVAEITGWQPSTEGQKKTERR
ncbi:HAD-IB family hydrolase [Kineosporia sp. J2-2]|uniref:HAD-IB family hydrolase n=1 Tax=Kineosporia corallincola TaxID=2835133 RepID=A0ABS5T9J0_9ACTN|nr:HAD-IB family hydrolase [Kineosporia corallincola]MBT0767740.1 HAD-IB family hydrolase [Kineosporia corallincola]